jgi:hypothetical protein
MGTEVSMVVGRLELGNRECAPRPYKPVTINNLPLNESCVKIRALADSLPILMRDGRVSDLCEALATIECEAREAGYLVNDMVWPR